MLASQHSSNTCVAVSIPAPSNQGHTAAPHHHTCIEHASEDPASQHLLRDATKAVVKLATHTLLVRVLGPFLCSYSHTWQLQLLKNPENQGDLLRCTSQDLAGHKSPTPLPVIEAPGRE